MHNSAGYRVTGVYDINRKKAAAGARFIGPGAVVYRNSPEAVRAADIIFITTPDDAIESACRAVSAGLAPGDDKIVLHCSGSQPSGALKSAKRHKKVHIASLHPMRTFADKDAAIRNFRGTYCAYEGDLQGLAVVRNIVMALGGIPVKIKAKDKILYHVGCVFASNYLVTLIKASRDFLKSCGFNDKCILKAVRPLIYSGIENIMAAGVTGALTGPVSRGDVLTVRKHLKSVRKSMSSYLALYRELGRHTLAIALEKRGISKSQALRLRKELK